MTRSHWAACLGMALALASGPVLAQDIFIGTVGFEKAQVVLTRCDLGGNRYILRDRPGEREKPVADLRERLKTLKAPVYVEVLGQYVEQGEDNALDVIALENLQAGKSCHLADVFNRP